MLDKHVNRLPVVDDDGVLVGIVTRADLVRAFVHSDAEIAQEIREEVLLRELWLRPEDFELTVESGEVTVAGHLPERGRARAADPPGRARPGRRLGRRAGDNAGLTGSGDRFG